MLHPDSLQAQIDIADKNIAALKERRHDLANHLKESRARLFEINALRGAGFTFAEIGQRKGVTAQAIQSWLRGPKRTKGKR